jgi:hypothetical protein
MTTPVKHTSTAAAITSVVRTPAGHTIHPFPVPRPTILPPSRLPPPPPHIPIFEELEEAEEEQEEEEGEASDLPVWASGITKELRETKDLLHQLQGKKVPAPKMSAAASAYTTITVPTKMAPKLLAQMNKNLKVKPVATKKKKAPAAAAAPKKKKAPAAAAKPPSMKLAMKQLREAMIAEQKAKAKKKK